MARPGTAGFRKPAIGDDAEPRPIAALAQWAQRSIPGFSLIWVLMLDDYLLYTGDLGLVRECAGGVYSVLRSFERYLTRDGFLANVPYWNYDDWTFPDAGT